MREYAGIVRAIMRGEDPPEGERFRTGFHFMGLEPRPDIPIYVAGLSPGMLRLAGEIADGAMLWLCTPAYIRDVVVPAVSEGRVRAGKSLEGFDLVAAVPAAAAGDPGEARERLRQELQPYFSLPFYLRMIEHSGYPTSEVSDRFLDDLAAIGTPDQAAAVVRSYRDAGARSPAI